MCGIVLVHSFNQAVDARGFQRALNSIQHRGPDDSGQFFADSAYLALGHTRLAINGGEQAQQPLKSANGRWHATVNGEIYNSRDQFPSRTFTYRTQSDSEILLNAFIADRADGLAQLDGEFAFALWHSETNTSYLGRDPHGIKPLYYTIYDGQLIAASEIKALLQYGVPSRWNLDYLVHSEYFVQDAQQTIVDNIFALPPGYLLEFSADGIKITPYASPSPLKPTDYAISAIDFEQAKIALTELLHLAVSKRLSKEHKTACYLSAGVDSTLITALAAQQAPVSAFTLAFEQKVLDESAQAQHFARAMNIDHHIIAVTDADLAQHFPDALYHSEMAVPNMNIAAKFMLSRSVRNAGFKIALTGEGADESLLGYGFFRQDLMAPYSQSNWNAYLEPIQKRLGFIPAQIVHAAQHHTIYNDLRSGESFPHNANRLMDIAGPVRYQALGTEDELIRMSQNIHYRSSFQTYNLGALGDRTEMAHGIEGRPPFLDKSLVNFIHSLPSHYKFRDGVDKYILREVSKDLLPTSAYTQQPKKPLLTAPTSLRAQGPLAELFQYYLLDANTHIPIYSQNRIREFYRSSLLLTPVQQMQLDPVFVHLCSLSILQERLGLY
jgi:asparagine synthase (glutamine-hydrolysing)